MPKKKKAVKPAVSKKKSAGGKTKTRRQTKTRDGLSDNPQVPALFTITNVEQLNAVASSKRQKILAEFIEEARTTKQVAERLGEPATRLYHHVDALVKHGILVLEREAQKRGTVEKYYRSAGRQFRVDDSCVTDSSFQDEHSRFVSEMLHTAENKLLEFISSAAAGEEPLHTTVASAMVNATDDEIEKISQQLIDDFEGKNTAKSSNKRRKGANNYRIVLLIYPDEE